MAYRKIRMSSWGPLRVFAGIREVIDPDLPSLLAELLATWATRAICPGRLVLGQTYEVETAAEAALLLHLDQEASILQGSPTLYRGQADCPGWTIQATLDRNRKSGTERQFLVDFYGSILFHNILQRIDWQADDWFSKGWHLSEGPAMAMARHHGMPSSLIDLTLDPSVAVRFAIQQSRAVGAGYAKVFRFFEDDLGPDANFSIPPPPTLRSVRQHGVFYNNRVENDLPVEPDTSKTIVLSFPSTIESSILNDFIRDGDHVDLMHDEPLLSQIETLVRQTMQTLPGAAIHAEYLEIPDEVPMSLQQIATSHLLTLCDAALLTATGNRYRYKPSAALVHEWFVIVTDMLHGLCAIFYDAETKRTAFRRDLLRTFVKHNYVSSQILLIYFSRIYRGTPLESLLPIFRILNSELINASGGSVGIYSPDFAIKGGTNAA